MMRTFVKPETTYFHIPTGMINSIESKEEIHKDNRHKNLLCQISRKHNGYTVSISYGVLLDDSMILNSEILDEKNLYS